MILPSRKDERPGPLDSMADSAMNYGWNQCLDEIDRLNKQESKPQVGETWYVSINRHVEAHKAKIVELTDMTVVLEQESFSFFGDATQQTRYVRSKITFLERIDKT